MRYFVASVKTALFLFAIPAFAQGSEPVVSEPLAPQALELTEHTKADVTDVQSVVAARQSEPENLDAGNATVAAEQNLQALNLQAQNPELAESEPLNSDLLNQELGTDLSVANEPPRNKVEIAERFEFDSEILDEPRSFQVYLPPSYYSNPQSNYPVLYLLDGDYSFHTMTGVVEYLSSVGHYIPEMIVVGISSRGTKPYRQYMYPNMGRDKRGDADTFLKYIESELKPRIQQDYRTAEYDILMGQSVAGLFTVYSLLALEDSFDAYIAVSPMIWWQDHRLEESAERYLKKLKAPSKKLYLSLANENRMGVYGLVEQLDRSRSEGVDWHFQRYEDENHGSVGMVALKDALKDLFKGWYQSYSDLAEFKNFSAVREHYVALLNKFGIQQPVPKLTFQALMHQYKADDRDEQSAALYLQTAQFLPNSATDMRNHLVLLEIKSKNYDKAQELIKESEASNPNDYRVQQMWSQWHLAQGEQDQALEFAQSALALAQSQNQRRWLLELLAAELREIEGM